MSALNRPAVVNLTLLLIAFIWGAGFVPQRLGMEYLGPSAFNALRFAFGACVLVPVLFLFKNVTWQSMFNRQTMVMGMILGALLFGGAFFQQVSIQYTSLANVAFITGLYVIIVPMLGYWVGYRYSWVVWVGGLVAIIGLYLMTGLSNGVSLKGDFLALIGAVFWSLHLLVLAMRAGSYNQLALAFFQFVFCALFSAIFALSMEPQLLPDSSMGYLWPIVNGVIVVGIAYTLQVIVMDRAEPFLASLILALEAVFGALAGYLIFSEHLAWAALLGAALMLIGCLLAQLPGTSNLRLSVTD